jgi:uncharacterized protein YbjT (DUF2867 family)
VKIAVSGASGLIGGALLPALRADGHEVLVLVRRTPRTADEHGGTRSTAGSTRPCSGTPTR